MRLNAVCGALLLGSLLLASGARAAEVTPHELLERMNEAVRLLDYEGRFVVQVGDLLDALYIVHRVDSGSEKERVVSLTGKPREIIRSDQAVACPVEGGDRHVNVGRRARGRSFSPLNGVSGEQLKMSYEMELLPASRVAGRDTYQVLVRPRDDLRYGYRLFIDRDSALPLRSVMFDEAQRTISQMMFVDLKTGDATTPIERDIAAMEFARADTAQVPLERLSRPGWVFSELPPGFQLNVHRRRPLVDAAVGELEHFIFSDGLATVSVYIQPHSGDDSWSGESALGVAKAVGRVLGEHEVIVVGEVPVKTLRWFAEGVRAVAP